MKEKKVIVICDDDKIDIKLFKKHFGLEKLKKYELLEVNSAEELKLLLKDKNTRIDLLFLDVYFGEANGLELLREIRKKNNFPVIMLTGRGDEVVAVESMKEGACDYIPKDSIDSYDLEKTIIQSIQKWEIEQERDQLLGIAAHELRNPISVILGYTEMLLDYNEINEEIKSEFIGIIRERANHILNIINELLDITRIEKGIVSIKKKSADLVDVAKRTVENFKYIADKKKIKVVFHSSSGELFKEFDSTRIEEVLSNFIDNAIKYSPANTKVTVEVNNINNKAVIKIEDQGLGIKEQELKFLFNLFSSKKISTLPTGDESRTGLGLAICKKVIDAHGGEILVESKIGKGTTFIIMLP
jgi:signal transduction histidine kinase